MKTMTMTLIAILTSAVAHAAPTFVKKSFKGKDARGEFDIQYVQLVPGRDSNPLAIRKINETLKKEARESICEPADGQWKPEDMSSNRTSKVTRLDSDVVSIQINYDLFCGGAYPDYGITSSLFDLNTGRQVDFRRDSKSEELWHAIVQARLKAGMPTGADLGDCEEYYKENARDGFSFKALAIKAKTIEIQTDYPHAIQACDFSVEIPLKDLLPIAKRGTLLERLAKRSLR